MRDGDGMRAVFLGENLLYLRAVRVNARPMSGKRNRIGGRFWGEFPLLCKRALSGHAEQRGTEDRCSQVPVCFADCFIPLRYSL